MYITKNILTLFSKFFKYFVWKFHTFNHFTAIIKNDELS
ncbi:hypothetical protein SK271_1165 [Streptococcus mitis]|uniref:Uncharacterized protein n=1 Tax=Streptococcus mitis TaxID=28037 RepID=A0A081SB54_STRMT|nr:hypothetical protein HMPREF1114_1911 [Streptococcus oralis SK100]EID22321.1 hypothetical protein HMPREF1045_0115 [Streptococcus mitis SK616]KER08157.1 hypothetical protein SK271_1165 [Streptococcus mitis]